MKQKSRCSELYEFDPMLGPPENYPVGSPEWAERISNRLQNGMKFISSHTAQHVGKTVRQIWDARPPPWKVWPVGSPIGTPDDYCRAVTGFEWNTLLEVVGEYVPVNEMRGALARAQVEHRKPGAHHDNIMMSRQGTSAAYLLRRLARDHPEILAAYEAGEFPSVRAAAKEAGIIKEPSQAEQILRILPKLQPHELLALREVIDAFLRQSYQDVAE
jgi:hypothetical protein